MSKQTILATVEIMPLDDLIKYTQNRVEDISYELQKTKSPKSKREKTHALSFWASMNNYLTELQKIKENEQQK